MAQLLYLLILNMYIYIICFSGKYTTENKMCTLSKKKKKKKDTVIFTFLTGIP